MTNGNTDKRSISERANHWALEYILALEIGEDTEVAKRQASEISGFNPSPALLTEFAKAARARRNEILRISDFTKPE